MRKDLAVQLTNLSKIYKLYEKPIDRLKESLHPLKKKYYKEFYALKNINLEITKGEVLGIVGVNGAGKSTLLKIISGVLTPTTGRVKIHGRINAILELGSSLKPEMTGRENIKLNLQINGIEKDREKLTQEIIEFADIGEHIDQAIKSYSSGMKARLSFAIATSTDPDVLIVDEVLAVGDVLFQRKCFSKIEKLFKDGKTVIFVSHSAQSVVEFCSRAVLLYDREVIMDDTPKKVTDYYQKLVFSKDKQKVLDEINGGKVTQADPNITVDTNKAISDNKSLNVSEESLNADQYLPALVSIPDYINNDIASFDNISIYNSQNTQINVLQLNHRYRLSFQVTWHRNLENVFFGARFLTLKGVVLTGVNNKDYYTNKPLTVKKNEIFDINIEFDCLLLPDTYIVKLFTSDENTWSIVNDAYMFKVKNTSWSQGGHVHLKQTIAINKMNGQDNFKKLI